MSDPRVTILPQDEATRRRMFDILVDTDEGEVHTDDEIYDMVDAIMSNLFPVLGEEQKPLRMSDIDLVNGLASSFDHLGTGSGDFHLQEEKEANEAVARIEAELIRT